MIVVRTLLNSCVVVLASSPKSGQPLRAAQLLFEEFQLSFEGNAAF